jgi:hypothetical protein
MASRKHQREVATTNEPRRDWIDLLQSANIKQGETIPSGFKSNYEWMAAYDISRATWERNAPQLEKAGKLERKYFKALSVDGRVIKRPYWRKV